MAVAATIDEGRVLLAEAGTGTGKTLAYLVPAVLSGRRVLVSTGTKTLQEQILTKDIPELQASLGVPFTAKWRGEISRSRSGSLSDNECVTPDWSLSGATIHTSSARTRAIFSQAASPGE
mgnify:CR=1 FL=1